MKPVGKCFYFLNKSVILLTHPHFPLFTWLCWPTHYQSGCSLRSVPWTTVPRVETDSHDSCHHITWCPACWGCDWWFKLGSIYEAFLTRPASFMNSLCFQKYKTKWINMEMEKGLILSLATILLNLWGGLLYMNITDKTVAFQNLYSSGGTYRNKGKEC